MSSKNLHNKLNRFQSAINSAKITPRPTPLPERYPRLAEAVDGALVTRSAGSYCLVRTLYPNDHVHGTKMLGEAAAASSLPVSAFTALEAEGRLDLPAMLFFDVETTGLGGAGAVAFLVGVGSVTPDGFEVRQYLLPDYSDEAALLEDLLEEFGSDAVLVSYNGTAFDLPLIRDRMIINRVTSDLPHRHHVDLLHAVRRLFKRRLKDCRLVNVENDLFNLYRTDDIPGYLIPSIYFEWLSEENLELMPTVLEHNRLDIVSLLYLVSHVARIYESRGEILSQTDDLHSLSRVYGRRKQPHQVESIFYRLGELASGALADDVMFFHAMNFKRIKAYEKAVPIWLTLAEQDSREAFLARLELAKFYEHNENNLEKARQFTLRAQQLLPSGKPARLQLDNRLKRLNSRLKS